MFEKGDIVEKYSGDYGGPGVIEAVLDISDGRRRYLVAHKISGGWGYVTPYLWGISTKEI